jgi:hypothetical protein
VKNLVGVLLGLACAMGLACSGATTMDEMPCPPTGTTYTYESFGKAFFATHCVGCHGGPNGYSSRAFGSLESIRSSRDRIFVNAAADNASMPPGPDGPTRAEREALAEWLRCGAP